MPGFGVPVNVGGKRLTQRTRKPAHYQTTGSAVNDLIHSAPPPFPAKKQQDSSGQTGTLGAHCKKCMFFSAAVEIKSGRALQRRSRGKPVV
jgi:hypothetical protein